MDNQYDGSCKQDTFFLTAIAETPDGPRNDRDQLLIRLVTALKIKSSVTLSSWQRFCVLSIVNYALSFSWCTTSWKP